MTVEVKLSKVRKKYIDEIGNYYPELWKLTISNGAITNTYVLEGSEASMIKKEFMKVKGDMML